jgi:hypothetical protein
MGTTLHDKIISYPVETLVEFNEAYTFPPTQEGTVTDSASFWSLTGRQPVYDATGGPKGEGGSWRFVSDAANGCRLRNQGSITSRINDQDYSVGAWIKINTFPPETEGLFPPIITHQPTSLGGYLFSIFYTAENDIFIPVVSFSNQLLGAQASDSVTLNEWNYVAARRSGTTFEFYVNGTLSGTFTNYTGTNNGATLNFGQIYQGYDFSQNISNYYIGTYSSVDATAISEIWQAGLAVVNKTITQTAATASALMLDPIVFGNANISKSPATANATQTDPTIAVTSGDHVEITTSIPVSALMSPVTVSAQRFINLTTEALTANVELINNVIITGSDSADFSAEEFLASAELVEPFVARSAMFASAQMGNNTSAFVSESYYGLVKQKSPFLYIYDGQLSPVNDGFRSHTFTRSGTAFAVNQTSPLKLALVNEGKSWRWTASATVSATFTAQAATYNDSFPALMAAQNNNFTIEFWVNTNDTGFARIVQFGGSVRPFLQIRFSNGRLTYTTAASDTGGEVNHTGNIAVDPNNWHHVVVTGTKPLNSNTVSYQAWINGALDRAFTVNYSARNLSNSVTFGMTAATQSPAIYESVFLDEVALYDKVLSNSEIQQHFNFINELGPDKTINANLFAASADSGSHQFSVVSNSILPSDVFIANATMPDVTFFAGRSINFSALPMQSSTLIIHPSLSLGSTTTATPSIASAESVNAFALNTIYFDYVQQNIAPYRYVSFDGQNTLSDYGSDNDYSVTPTSLGGSIVNPGESINGRSAKTAGLSYVTDGVILKESEWDDTWGTGQFSYHSSFWMKKAPEDNSTGLRILWNLNGHLDNQHVILYQYQNKLHMQFNNGSGTHVDSVTDNNIDLFDGERHLVVVAFDHTNNNNNQVLLYVDGILALTTNLGSYTGQTINGTTFVGPNDDNNNHPRLGVGCLITPFGVTALPVVPTNTKLYIDEIIWAKTAISQLQVTNLYNAMPESNNFITSPEAFVASSLIVSPAVSTTVLFNSDTFIASATMTNVSLNVQRNIANSASPMTATIELVSAQRLDNVTYQSDVMVATATFNNPGVAITISGGPMLANALLVMPPETHAGRLTSFSAYVRYLRSEAKDGIAIYSMKEIK